MKVVVISGSPRKNANTQIMMKHVFDYTKQKDVDVKFINLSEGGFEYYRGFLNEIDYNEKTLQAAKDITEADVWLIGTPIYNSMFSAALKNLFEFVNYKETSGKMAGLAILASGMIGFTDVQTLLTQLMSYFRVATNPVPVFVTADKIEGGEIASVDVKARLDELVDRTLEMAQKS
ncbi:MAG: NAD(P)H-dependent oxidoreductase [Thermoproteota archaeon]|nr:NAD(P)H-dependent oxidoreductase [Thermoproteota archaeon]